MTWRTWKPFLQVCFSLCGTLFLCFLVRAVARSGAFCSWQEERRVSGNVGACSARVYDDCDEGLHRSCPTLCLSTLSLALPAFCLASFRLTDSDEERKRKKKKRKLSKKTSTLHGSLEVVAFCCLYSINKTARCPSRRLYAVLGLSIKSPHLHCIKGLSSSAHVHVVCSIFALLFHFLLPRCA